MKPTPPAAPAPPAVPERPHRHEEHGIVRDDPWYWLRDRDDTSVREHLEAENAYTELRTAHLARLRDTLVAEYRSRIQEDDGSVPAKDGPWAYYVRLERDRPYPIHCRRPAAGGAEQVMLDVNLLAEGRAFCAVDGVDWSPDHHTLAYATDFTSDERFTLRFRALDDGADLRAGDELPDTIPNTNGGMAWVDGRTVWAVTLDESLRPYQVWQRRLGDDGVDRLIVQEDDERFRVHVGRSRSGRFLYLTFTNVETTEVRLVELVDGVPHGDPQPLFPRTPRMRVQVSHCGSPGAAGDRLYVITNVGADGVPGSAPNGRLLELPLAAPGSDRPWGEPVERLPHDPDVQLVGIQGFATFAALTVRDRGQLAIRVIEGDRIRDLPLLEVPSAVGVGENHEWHTRTLRVGYGSLTTPKTTLAYDLDAPESPPVRLKEAAVPGYDRTRYRTVRLEAVAEDGVRIPLSVVHGVDVDLAAGPHPTVLYGYGAYGIPLDPAFVSTRVSLLDRGVVFVVAHVRGGGDLGRPWYEAGKLEHKPRSFTDFVAAARHLVAQRVATPDRLVAHGGSAGGLLVGASMNLAPELFCGVVAQVPFVDVLTTMLDASLPLTAGEWDEWGDPRERAWFDLIRSYSPIDNLRPVAYPDVLATAGWGDQRVQYWEPAKWIAKLRKVATRGEFLLRTELDAGHQGPSGRYAPLVLAAFTQAWVLDKLGRA